MARATVLELVDAGNLWIGKDYILSSIRIKAAFGVAWASVVLLPVHRPVPLCAKMAVFDATMTHKWTGMGGFHNALTVFVTEKSSTCFSSDISK